MSFPLNLVYTLLTNNYDRILNHLIPVFIIGVFVLIFDISNAFVKVKSHNDLYENMNSVLYGVIKMPYYHIFSVSIRG